MKKRLLWLAMALFVSTGLMAQSWYLAGSSTSGDSGWLDGKNWDASGTAMTDNGDGTFSYSTTVQAGTYEFKVTNGTWDTSYGYDNVNSIASTSGYENAGGNVKFTISEQAAITISLNPEAADNEKITLTSSIPFGQAVITVWTVVGDDVLCGTNWDVSDTGNDMVEGESGIWTKTYENFEVTADNAGAEISFKAVANHSYSIGEYPQGEGGNATLTLPSETGTYNIIITLDTNSWSIDNTIEKVVGEEPEPGPAEPVLLIADDIAVSWNEPVYNAETKELQLSCTFDIAETQTSVSIDDLLAANPVCFIRFGASGDVRASRDGNAVSVTIPNVEAGAELAYSLNMNIGADNADVIVPVRIEIVKSEWVYAPSVPEPEPEPEPGITTLYMIGDATQGGWALENATALAYDADSKTFTWTGDLTVGTEGFKFVVSNTAYVPCFVAASEGQQIVSGEQVALVYRENEEAGAPADYKFKVPEDGNYTVVVTMDGTEASMVVTQNSVAPVPQWYVAGNGNENVPEWVNGKNWNPDAAPMTANGDGTFSYSTTIPAGTYEFKVTNGTWEAEQGSVVYDYNHINAATSASGYENAGGNVKFTISEQADITISLNPEAADNEKITLTSSIPFGQAEITLWTVVGDAALCGSDWDPADANNDMAEDAETPGIWTKTYENFEVNADNAGTVISFKAVANHNYSVGEVPQGEGNNATLTLPEETGIYNITIILNTNDWTISNSIDKVGGEEPEPVETTAEWSFLLNGDNSLTVICTVNALGGQTDPSAVAGLVGWMYVDNPATQLGWVAGSFEIMYTTEVLTDGQTVALNATWNWQDGGVFTAPETFIYTFNEEEPEPVPAAWYIAGNGDVDAAWVGGLSWDVAGVALADNGDGTYGYETTVPAGTYQFKITNGKWYDPENTPDGINYGYTNVDGVASTSGYVDGGGNNVMFTIASEATITITLNPAAMDDAKIILSSTVGFGEAVVDRWTLAGDVPFFAGSAWGFDAGNDLVETAPGVWTKVYENVEVTSDMAGQTYQYKVGANGGFDVDQYPAQGNNTFTMPAEAGSYNITFTFNAEGERTLGFECVMNEPTSIDEAAAAVITAADGRIYCDKDFVIVNLAGQDVTAANGDLQGTYLVVAGDEVVKVMVD